MAIGTVEVGAPVNLSASGQIGGGTAMARGFQGGPNDAGNTAETTALQCAILGFYVCSTTTGVITINASAGGTAYTGNITPAIGWNFLPIIGPTGLYMTLVSGSINVTFAVVE
jgi:hypothetical protein